MLSPVVGADNADWYPTLGDDVMHRKNAMRERVPTSCAAQTSEEACSTYWQPDVSYGGAARICVWMPRVAKCKGMFPKGVSLMMCGGLPLSARGGVRPLTNKRGDAWCEDEYAKTGKRGRAPTTYKWQGVVGGPGDWVVDVAGEPGGKCLNPKWASRKCAKTLKALEKAIRDDIDARQAVEKAEDGQTRLVRRDEGSTNL